MKRFVVYSVFVVALFAASVGSARAQDAPLIQFGLRASIIAHSTYNDVYDYSPGFGFGAGLILKHTVSDVLGFSGEPSLYYRSLYSHELNKVAISVEEMALCIPLMANYYLSLDRFYVSGGLELDIPFNTQRFEFLSGVSVDNRSAVDVGFLIGAGYMIIDNVGVDARYVIYFNAPRKKLSELLMSYGIGLFLLF